MHFCLKHRVYRFVNGSAYFHTVAEHVAHDNSSSINIDAEYVAHDNSNSKKPSVAKGIQPVASLDACSVEMTLVTNIYYCCRLIKCLLDFNFEVSPYL